MNGKYLLVCALLLSPSAFAGTATSGGGKGVVCRNSDGTVKSVELLDLWEAREIYGRSPVLSEAPVEEQVKRAIEALKNVDDEELTNYSHDQQKDLPAPEVLAEVLNDQASLFLRPSRRVERLRGKTLTPTEDSFEAARPADCGVEQLVFFLDAPEEPRVLVNQDLVDAMDATNQAALYVHEALYRWLRYTFRPDTDSVRTRRAVGYVFSGQSFRPTRELIGDRYVVCQNAEEYIAPSDYTRVYFFSAPDGSVHAALASTFGRQMMGVFEPSQRPQFFKSFEDFFANLKRPCSRKYALTIGNWRLPAAGPVDFTESTAMLDVCQNGRKSLWLAPQLGGRVIPPGSQRLACKLVNKK